MKGKGFSFILIFTIFHFMCWRGYASDTKTLFDFGINYDYQLLINNLNLDTLNGVDQGGHFKNTSFGFAHRFGLDLSIPITNKISLNINPQYIISNLTIDSLSNIYTKSIDDGAPQDFVYREGLNYTSNYIQGKFGVEIKPIEYLSFNFSGFYQYQLLDELKIFQMIINKPTGKMDSFKGGLTQREITLKDEAFFNKEDLGISAKLNYILFLNEKKNLKLIPYINFDYNLSPVLGNQGWTNYGISAGIALKFDFNILSKENSKGNNKIELSELLELSGSASDLIYGDFLKYQYSDTSSNEFKNKKEQFKSDVFLSIKINSVDELNVETINPKIETEEIISENTIPLLNFIFFKENSTLIPKRYNQNQSEFIKNEKNNFSNNTLNLYYDILNILGKRLSKTNSKIELIGYNSGNKLEKDNTQLSKERAFSIAAYLILKWNIEKERIKISGSNLPPNYSIQNDPLGEEEKRRVEIISDDWEIIKPVQLQDTILSIKNSILRIYPELSDMKNITNKWIEISIDNNLVDKIQISNTKSYFDWDSKIILSKYTKVKKINFVFCAETKDNKVIKSEDIIIEVKTKTLNEKILKKQSDKKIDRFQLILFDFNQYEISNHNKLISNLIIKKLQNNSEVKISGYTDLIGNEIANKELSEKRAKKLADILSPFTTVPYIRGFGETNLLFDNSLPEGRFYSRTVITEILSPIQW